MSLFDNMTPHDKRIENIDRKMKIGRFSPHHPSQFVKSKALKKKVSSITQSKKERRRGDTSGASDDFFHSNER